MIDNLKIGNKAKGVLKKTFLGNMTPNELDDKFNEAYLGILANDNSLFNPLEILPSCAHDKFAEYICYLMGQPDYLYFLIKYILQIESWPQQVLLIKEMFTHRFPILLGSRGLSKSYSLAVYMLLRMILIPGTKCVITSAGFRQSKVVFEYMETIYKKSLMLQSCFPESRKNGPVHGTDVWTFRVGDSITYAIPVGPDGSKVRGYRANCVDKNTLIQTENGLVKIKDFKSTDCEYVMNIDGEFETPDKFYSTEPTDVYKLTTENGHVIKYSCLHRLYTSNGWKDGIDIKPGDEVFIDSNDYFPEDYAMFNGCQLDEYEIFNTGLINLSSLAAKEIPWYILQSPRNIIHRFLRMHFGTNWTNASYVTQHEEKAQQLQVLLLKFGYKSKVEDINSMFRITICGQITNLRFTEVVKSVEKLPEQDVLYDFVLPKTESFIGNGFVNHNCLICDEFACTRKSILQTDLGFLRIEDIVENRIKCNVINKYGQLEPIIDWVKTPKTDVYKLTTKYGYEIEFSEKHRFMLSNGEWKKGIELTSNDYLLFDNNYVFPKNSVDTYNNIDPVDLSYLYGLLISEGTLTNKNYISISNTDLKLLKDLKNRFKSLNPVIYKTKKRIDKRGWKTKQCYEFRIYNTEFREFLETQGLDYVTAHNKTIPKSILQSNKECVLSFLKGLYIGDGSVFIWKDKTRNKNRLGATYYTVSEILASQLHTLLKAMNYLAFKGSRKSKISKNKQHFIRLNGNFAIDFVKEIDYPKTNLMIKNLERSRVSSGGIYKTHNGKYITKYMHNNKNVFSKVFETKKDARSALDNFISNFKMCVQVKSVIKLDEQDYLYDITLPETHSYYANGLVNHNTVNRQVFEEVMSGFLSVAASPFEQIKYQAKQNAYKRFNIPIPKSSSEGDFIQNQLILSGTAYYKLNHFYAYFSKWQEIIGSCGDKKKLRALFENEEDAKDIDPNDYTIMRVPLELTANGYMDMAQISRIKASTTKDVFLREYGACLHPSTKIITKNGNKRIKDIVIGDEVLTHTGKFKKVNKLTYRKTDHLLELKFYGNNKKMYVTENHPIYTGSNEFEKANNISNITFSPLSKKSLSNKKDIKITDYIDSNSFNDYGDFIRSKHGSVVLSNNDIKKCIALYRSGKSIKNISKELNIKYNYVYNACKITSSFNSINPNIKVDYNLGLVLGFYVAEGSIGADGRAVSFALDSHVDKKLIDIKNNLVSAIKKSFNVDPKEYSKKDNTVNICINNKIIAQFIGKICPGNCYDKQVDTEILFSNEDFMKGFIEGFWDGDGFKDKDCAKTQICSDNLLTQIRLILSYFCIPHSYYTRKGNESIVNGKKYINSNIYKLEVFLQNNKLFKNTFFNEKNKYKIGHSKIFKKNKEIHYKLKSKNKINFNGYVYNIEVDDDNSYHTEFGCVHNCFNDDSEGFYKKSLIDSCTCDEMDKENIFVPQLYGDKNKKYVMGVDPAYEGDNFAIVIIEVTGRERRIVHCWTTQSSDHKQRLRDGITKEHQYFDYCARKIRSLMKHFPCEYIAIDKHGGGLAVIEALMDPTKLEAGEELILETIDPESKPKPTDLMKGLHMLHVIKPTSEWNAEANYVMKKDMEDKMLRFPFSDDISYALAEYYDESLGDHKSMYDTLDDCIFEIEELKKELTTITVSETGSGKEKFSTPENKSQVHKKGRLKKDRYSALLLANWVARTLIANTEDYINPNTYNLSGFIMTKNSGRLFQGNSQVVNKLEQLYKNIRK